MPTAVRVSCALRGAAPSATAALKPVTRFPSDGQMVVWDAVLTAAAEATTCEFEIEHAGAVLLAEVEAYE